MMQPCPFEPDPVWRHQYELGRQLRDGAHANSRNLHKAFAWGGKRP
jgi:hypothetical protein